MYIVRWAQTGIHKAVAIFVQKVAKLYLDVCIVYTIEGKWQIKNSNKIQINSSETH